MERFVEHAKGEILIAAVRADFGHEEHTTANALQAFSHPIFSLAAMIFPAVIEEGDAAVHRLADHPHRGGLVGGIADVVAAEAESGNVEVVAAERAGGNPSGLRHGESRDSSA